MPPIMLLFSGAKMVIYVEYVLISNFIIDFLLLKSAFFTAGEKFSNRRLFFCALLSSGFSLAYPLINASKIIEILIKISFGLLIVLISAKFINTKKYFICLSLFFFYTFLLGGITLALFFCFEISMQNEIVSLLIILPIYAIYRFSVKLANYLYRKKNLNAFTYQVELTIGDKTKSCIGFLDTGNGVYFQNAPVIFCSKKFALNLIDLTKAKGLKRITINTVNGSEQKLCVKTSCVKIYQGDKTNIFYNVTLCIVCEGFEEGYDLLLHPALLKEEYENKSFIQTKKVS